MKTVTTILIGLFGFVIGARQVRAAASWDTQVGADFDSAPFSGSIRAVAVSGTNVYAAFASGYGGTLGRWNRTAGWTNLAGIPNSGATQLIVKSGKVYCGCTDGVMVYDIATETIVTLMDANENPGPAAEAIAVANNGDVYIGGKSGVWNSNMAVRWNNSQSQWETLGNGTEVSVASDSGGVYALYLDESTNHCDLYLGGQFSKALGGGLHAVNLVRYDALNGKWNGVGTTNQIRTDIIGYDPATSDPIYFTTIGPRMLTSEEVSLDQRNVFVTSIVRLGGMLYCVGWMNEHSIDSCVVDLSSGAVGGWLNLMRSENDIWAQPLKLSVNSSSVFVAGGFAYLNGNTWYRIAEWVPTTQTLNALDGGVDVGNGNVNDVKIYCVSSSDDSVFVGGYITEVGTAPLSVSSGMAEWRINQ